MRKMIRCLGLKINGKRCKRKGNYLCKSHFTVKQTQRCFENMMLKIDRDCGVICKCAYRFYEFANFMKEVFDLLSDKEKSNFFYFILNSSNLWKKDEYFDIFSYNVNKYKGEDDCAICYESMNEKEVNSCSECKHSFHHHCVRKCKLIQLDFNYVSVKCPMCRTTINVYQTFAKCPCCCDSDEESGEE